MDDEEIIAKLELLGLFERLMKCADAWEADALLYFGQRAMWRMSRATHLRILATMHYDEVAKALGETGG